MMGKKRDRHSLQFVTFDFAPPLPNKFLTKNYAFGSGVSQYKFTPDIDMAQAWQRIASGSGNDIDEVLLKHEVYESDLVINQGMNQIDAHNLTQEIYPWSMLLKKRNQQQ